VYTGGPGLHSALLIVENLRHAFALVSGLPVKRASLTMCGVYKRLIEVLGQ
jgi:hypothetical protein